MAALEVAQTLVGALADRELRVVFAESCTGGLISAELAKIPGVSNWLCGSAVTYRCKTKVQWLGVNEADIDRQTAVSAEVAGQMATGVLSMTSEASVAASITGHFGPGAPAGYDGVVFIGIAFRRESDSPSVEVTRHHLVSESRESRQQEAVELVLSLVLERLVGN